MYISSHSSKSANVVMLFDRDARSVTCTISIPIWIFGVGLGFGGFVEFTTLPARQTNPP